MLGDLILEHTGKVASTRLLDSKKDKMENSVMASGKAKGEIDIIVTITYWNIRCDGGLSYGEGNGQISIRDDSGDGRDVVKVTEYGVGNYMGQRQAGETQHFIKLMLLIIIIDYHFFMMWLESSKLRLMS